MGQLRQFYRGLGVSDRPDPCAAGRRRAVDRKYDGRAVVADGPEDFDRGDVQKSGTHYLEQFCGRPVCRLLLRSYRRLDFGWRVLGEACGDGRA
ncbi:hypothetical protein D1872_294350 [compost metagenome]